MDYVLSRTPQCSNHTTLYTHEERHGDQDQVLRSLKLPAPGCESRSRNQKAHGHRTSARKGRRRRLRRIRRRQIDLLQTRTRSLPRRERNSRSDQTLSLPSSEVTSPRPVHTYRDGSPNSDTLTLAHSQWCSVSAPPLRLSQQRHPHALLTSPFRAQLAAVTAHRDHVASGPPSPDPAPIPP